VEARVRKCRYTILAVATSRYLVQRQHTRYLLPGPIMLYRDQGGPGVPGVSMEVSTAGLSAVFTEGLCIGERVSLLFDLTPKRRLEVTALVRNKSQYRYGFEFTQLSGDEQEAIEAACASLPVYVGGQY